MLTASSMPLPNSMISLAAREPIGVPALADAVLAQRSQAGDRDAFARLAERHEEAVFRLAWRILRHREDAEDAAQETFLRAWRSLGRFDSRREFRPWLLRIAVNAALAMAEKRSLPQRNWGETKRPSNRFRGLRGTLRSINPPAGSFSKLSRTSSPVCRRSKLLSFSFAMARISASRKSPGSWTANPARWRRPCTASANVFSAPFITFWRQSHHDDM